MVYHDRMIDRQTDMRLVIPLTELADPGNVAAGLFKKPQR
jgi:hypothetical protein